MATAIETDLGVQGIDYQQAVVYIKTNWSAGWGDAVAHLYCASFTKSVAPQIGEASLAYEYGRIKRPDGEAYTNVSKQDIVGKYVKIVASPNDDGDDIVWIGIVIDETREPHGAPTIDGARVPSGNQRFTAASIEWLLTRNVIETSVVENRLQSNFLRIAVGRAIPFNAGTGTSTREPRANRSEKKSPEGVYIFSRTVGHKDSDAREWSSNDIVKYLLKYHTPRDAAGDPEPVFVFASKTEPRGRPTIHREGRTAYEILTQVMDRRRGVTFEFVVNEDTGEVEMSVHYLDADGLQVELPDGQTVDLPGNPNQKSLDFDRAFDVRPILFTDRAVKYKQVAVNGARRTSTFTCGVNLEGTYVDSGVLEEDWTSYEQGRYISPSWTFTPDDTTQKGKESAFDDYRQSEGLRRVFSWFRFPDNWDFRTDPKNSGKMRHVFPKINSKTGKLMPNQGIEYWKVGMRFSPYLAPFPIDKENPEQDETETDNDEQRMFGVAKLGNLGSSAKPLYQRLDRLSTSHRPGRDEYLGFSCYVRSRDDDLGVEVRVSGLQHLIAEDEFGNADPSADPSVEPAGKLDYKDFFFTATLQGDDACYWQHPMKVNAKTIEVLTINAGEWARLDYIVADTVTGVKEGGELIRHPGGTLRDDRRYLAEIAAAAYTWYQRDRAAFAMPYSQISTAFSLGDLITTIGADETLEQVNSMITGITWNFEQGTTAVATQYADFPIGERL